MILSTWAAKWGVSHAAVVELQREMGLVSTDPEATDGSSEAAVMNRVRLEESARGGRLFRNNVGAGILQDGSFVRWGLANESKQMNERIKSSDLIGIRPVLISPTHVGQTFGLFIAREVKAGNWRFTGTAREVAQRRFLDLITSLGGDAAFATGR